MALNKFCNYGFNQKCTKFVCIWEVNTTEYSIALNINLHFSLQFQYLDSYKVRYP